MASAAADETLSSAAKARSLQAFAEAEDSERPREVSNILNQVIRDIARDGESRYSWGKVRALLLHKLKEVVLVYRSGAKNDSKFNGGTVDGEDFETRFSRCRDFLSRFQRPPFTLQRMCELLAEPKRYYSTAEKFLRAFSKTVCGISSSSDTEFLEDAGAAFTAVPAPTQSVRRPLRQSESKLQPPGPLPPPQPPLDVDRAAEANDGGATGGAASAGSHKRILGSAAEADPGPTKLQRIYSDSEMSKGAAGVSGVTPMETDSEVRAIGGAAAD